MQKKGRKMTGQQQERKRTISFFILRSGGRIYFLACTADAPFLWLSFPCISCQARVFMKQKDNRIPLVNTSSSLQHPSQCQPKAFLSVPFILFFFFLNQEQDLRYVRSCLIQAWRKHSILQPLVTCCYQ